MVSPYLKEPGRLGDVIAAIQAMATYKFYKLDFDGWADRISTDKSQAQHWQRVFEEHPEFFRLDSERTRASLVWRRQYPKHYGVDSSREISKEEFDRLDSAEKARISRVPLPASDIKTLIDTAINIHSRALEAQKQQQWYKPLAFQAAAALVGALVGIGHLSTSDPRTRSSQRLQSRPQARQILRRENELISSGRKSDISLSEGSCALNGTQ